MSTATEPFSVVHSMEQQRDKSTGNGKNKSSEMETNSNNTDQSNNNGSNAQNKNGITTPQANISTSSPIQNEPIPISHEMMSQMQNSQSATSRINSPIPQLEQHRLNIDGLNQSTQSQNSSSHDTLQQMLLQPDDQDNPLLDDMNSFSDYNPIMPYSNRKNQATHLSLSNNMMSISGQGAGRGQSSPIPSQQNISSMSMGGLDQMVSPNCQQNHFQQQRANGLTQQHMLSHQQHMMQQQQMMNSSMSMLSGSPNVIGNAQNMYTNQLQQQQISQHQRQKSQNSNNSGGMMTGGGPISFHPKHLVGGWQSDEHFEYRKKILSKIATYLQQRRPNTNLDEWTEKVPQMARRLEDSLYRNAESFAVYNDMQTLRSRLQQLALKIGNKAQQAKLNHQQTATSLPSSTAPGSIHGGMMTVGENRMDMNEISLSPSIGISQMTGSQNNSTQAMDLNNNGNHMFAQNIHLRSQQQQQRKRNYADMNDKTGILSQQNCGVQMTSMNKAQSGPMSQNSNSEMSSEINASMNHQMFNGMQGKVLNKLNQSGMPHQMMHNQNQAIYSEEQKKLALQQQQQRLLLLRHASKCQAAEPEKCLETPHCANMKRLWKHIAECKERMCQVPHCVSSRFVLSHYHRCKDDKCTVCAPVREVIMNSCNKFDYKQKTTMRDNVRASPPCSSPTNNIAVLSGQVPALRLIGMPNLTKEESAALTHAQRNFLYQKSQILQQATTEARSRYSQADPNISEAQLKAFQKTEAEIAVANFDKRNGLIPSTPSGENGGIKFHPSFIDVNSAKNDIGRITKMQINPSDYSDRMKSMNSSNNASLGTKRVKTEFSPKTASSFPVKMEPSVVSTPEIKIKNEPLAKVEMMSAEDCTSLCEAFEEQEIIRHCESLRDVSAMGAGAGSKVKDLMGPTLRILQESQYGWVFNTPVDPLVLCLPDYFNIIKHPMDLGTIRKKLDAGGYVALDAVADDIRLTFNNAMQYNTPGTEVYPVAEEMLRMFETMFIACKERIKNDPEAQRVASDRCALCGFSQLTWEPPVYYCNGSSCGMSRIRRNSHFFTAGSNQFHWCAQCYGELRDNEPVRVGEHVLSKRDLVRKKNDEVQEEPWVECTDCSRWAHQACSLFNARRNFNEDVPFSCPDCILAKRRSIGNMAPTARKLGGKDIPHTSMSKFIEEKVLQKLMKCYSETAKAEGIQLLNVVKANPIHIKVVSNQEVTHVVKQNFAKRFGQKGYPTEFQARSKCLLLFQELDGVDVLLFGMYVYEYGHNCGSPNQRRVYVSYLDSVHYFRPRQYRTIVYKEIIVAYLEYVKKRGFHTAHIWACPPLKGDDYILYCHPEDQKTPKDDRLQNWYLTLLEDAKERGIVECISNLYDEFWSDLNSEPTCLPYLEGDYWIGEAEHIIKDLENQVPNTGGQTLGRKQGGLSKMRKKGANSRKRDSKGISNVDGKCHKNPVMHRLGEIIGPMKSSFIVAHLRDRTFAQAMKERHAEEVSINLAKVRCTQMTAAGRVPDPTLQALAQKPIAQDETLDTEESLFSEIFDTRQTFLNLCQGNHYQFDQLRRAKHSSMMVLYFLSTPGAPKFLSTCSRCNREILTGSRFLCRSCEGFELCSDCYQRVGHPHELRPVPVGGKTDKQVGGKNGANAEAGSSKIDSQRKERQFSINLHMQLLTHANACSDTNCPSTNCNRMKELLNHVATCPSRVRGAQCSSCKRIVLLLKLHARQCKKENCLMPHCMTMRQNMRAVLEQQQQMDDRRRQHMYEWYRERAQAANSGGMAPSENST